MNPSMDTELTSFRSFLVHLGWVWKGVHSHRILRERSVLLQRLHQIPGGLGQGCRSARQRADQVLLAGKSTILVVYFRVD